MSVGVPDLARTSTMVDCPGVKFLGLLMHPVSAVRANKTANAMEIFMVGSSVCCRLVPTAGAAALFPLRVPAAAAIKSRRAPVAQWIEQSPPKGQVARSIRVWGAISRAEGRRQKAEGRRQKAEGNRSLVTKR